MNYATIRQTMHDNIITRLTPREAEKEMRAALQHAPSASNSNLTKDCQNRAFAGTILGDWCVTCNMKFSTKNQEVSHKFSARCVEHLDRVTVFVWLKEDASRAPSWVPDVPVPAAGAAANAPAIAAAAPLLPPAAVGAAQGLPVQAFLLAPAAPALPLAPAAAATAQAQALPAQPAGMAPRPPGVPPTQYDDSASEAHEEDEAVSDAGVHLSQLSTSEPALSQLESSRASCADAGAACDAADLDSEDAEESDSASVDDMTEAEENPAQAQALWAQALASASHPPPAPARAVRRRRI
jgi:hypothetical protein